MEPESNSDNEEKKDPNITEAMKEKAQGKMPIEEQALSSDDSDLDTITRKAEVISIEEGKKLESHTVIGTSATFEEEPTDYEKSKGEKTENVIKRSYNLRSSHKEMMDVNAELAKRGKKRKGEELKRRDVDSSVIGKRRRDKDDDRDGTGACVTRSSTKKARVRSR